MEVFLRGVPQHFSDKALAEALGPLMRALNVGEWITKKQRRNGIAWITFLEEGDGWRFLEKHGMQEPPSPSDPSSSYTHIAIRTTPTGDSYIARLFLMVTPVLAQLSDRVVDQLTLNHLRFQRDQRAQEPRDEPRGPALACMVTEISCGHNMFLSGGDTPTFVQQSVLPTRCSVNIGRRFFVATFEDGSRMNIAFDTVDSWVFSYGHDTLSLILKESPKCFRRSETFLPLSVKWDRCLFLPSWPDHAKYMANCLVYQFSLSAFKREDLVAHLESVETVSLSICNSPIIRSPRPFVVDYTTAYHVFEDQINANDSSLVPYALRFQVQMLVWNAYLHPSNALDLLKLLRDEFRAAKSRGHGAPVTTESLKPLFDNIPYASPGREAKDFSAQALMKYILLNEAELRHGNPNRDKLYGPQLPNSQIWVFKAHVTPTSIRLSGPEPENKNSVWRTYEDRSDYFLRVTFCDEDHKRPQYNTNVSTKDVSNRYREVFRTGIFIAGRHFSFLGFSHSSLRAHTTWFSAPFVDENGVRHTPETILKALGSFDHISVPARYAARIGQAFSETPYAISLGQCGIVVKDIEDIQSSDGSRVFSDGIGTLSRGALDEILQFLPWHSAASTCLQIRLGGVKGVLSLDSRLGGKVICICDSMRKFPSDSNDELGICETGSRPLPMWLNRQLIKIMEDLGTDPDWIKGQQRKNIEALRQVGTSPEKAGAFLESQGIGRHIKFPWLMKQLSEMDLDFRSDKYLKSVVEHAVLRELRLLKYKARIRVEQGVTLFGVLDEHDFLEEDQVYVTYDRKHRLFSGGIGLSIQDGPVLVTRSPALHPGDVRVVKHVTPPAEHPLRELRNCIVFSQKGERGLPSQLSGGDLDGDLYNIIWDSGALPRKQSTPAGYPHVHAKPLDRDVTQDDIANFFIKFMETDILGVIATRHQVLSDISGMGTCDATCIKLAEMHSVAVDYAKTGKAVELSELPRAPRTRPDFLGHAAPLELQDSGQLGYEPEYFQQDGNDEEGLGRTIPKYHRSDKILGQLYRAVDEIKIWNEGRAPHVARNGPSVWSQLLGLVETRIHSLGLGLNYKRKKRLAEKICNMYEKALRVMMREFSESRRSLSEQEVFCGSIFNKKSVQTRRQRDASLKLQEAYGNLSAWYMNVIRRRTEFESDLSGPEGWSDQEQERQRENALELSWACLVVGSSRDGPPRSGGRNRQEVQSFVVVAACCILKELQDLSKLLSTGYGINEAGTWPLRSAAGTRP